MEQQKETLLLDENSLKKYGQETDDESFASCTIDKTGDRQTNDRFASCGNCTLSEKINNVKDGFSNVTRAQIVVFDRGGVTGQRYVEEIFQDRVVPFAQFVGEIFI